MFRQLKPVKKVESYCAVGWVACACRVLVVVSIVAASTATTLDAETAETAEERRSFGKNILNSFVSFALDGGDVTSEDKIHSADDAESSPEEVEAELLLHVNDREWDEHRQRYHFLENLQLAE